MAPLVQLTENGLYCAAGDFYIDPWRGVPRAVITHGHSDHARGGSQHYLTSQTGKPILERRLGTSSPISGLPYGESLSLGGVSLSLIPAGHVLGSAQIRIEHKGQVCVVSGDYKVRPSPTAEPFEPVRCHHFISECTFGLPIYRWPLESLVIESLHQWWRSCQDDDRTAVVFAYSLGKAQRIIAQLDAATGPILVHSAILQMLEAYELCGISFPPYLPASPENAKAFRGKAIVIAPPATNDSTWLKKFGTISTAVASGWMQLRGTRRRGNVDRGFVLSDHADWDGLNSAIAATEAELVWLTHGNTAPLQRFLREQGRNVSSISTRFTGDIEETEIPSVSTPSVEESA